MPRRAIFPALPLLATLATLLALIASESLAADAYETGLSAYLTGDYTTAQRAWSQAAGAGDGRGAHALGVMHEHGIGRSPDPRVAATWYDRAARLGWAPGERAWTRLVRRYGFSVTQSDAPPDRAGDPQQPGTPLPLTRQQDD